MTGERVGLTRPWLVALILALSIASLGAAAGLWSLGRFRVVDPRLAGGLFAASVGGGVLAAALSLARSRARWVAAVGGLAAAASGLAFALRFTQELDSKVEIRQQARTAVASHSIERLRAVQLNVLHGYPDRADLDERVERLVASLRRLRPDIVILQEAWRYRDRDPLVDTLAAELGMASAYARANGSLQLIGFEEGSAILSRYPILAAERLELAPRKNPFEHRIALRARIDLGRGRTESVVGVHLAHQDPTTARQQAAHLVDLLDDQEPLLLSGDLNRAVDSDTLGTLAKGGYRPLLSDGIDHVLQPARDDWKLVWSEVALPESAGLSDHPGLLVELARRAEPANGRWRPDWETAEPASLGFDEVRLRDSALRIGELDGVMALIVLRHGRFALESYFRGGAPDRLHNMKSASKSLLSTLVGLAIEEGHLELETPVVDLLAHDDGGDEARSGIQIGHLLTMSSGLESTSFANYGRWVSSRNWVASALSRPMESAPGEVFRYSTGNTHLLSAALTAATERSSLDYARSKLFEPLGIDQANWERDRQGIYLGGNNLSLTPRAMARFGQLYLDRGRWHDEQVVPWQWIDDSVRPRAHSSWSGRGYGYLWWLRPEDERGAYMASGHGGQYVYVSPYWDLVVVVNSTEPSKGRQWRRDIFREIREGIIGGLPAYPTTRPGVE